MAEGDLAPEARNGSQEIASAADWFDIHGLDISGETTAVVGGYLIVSTKWAKEMVKGFHNVGATTATIICQTIHGAADVTIKVASEQYSGKLPAINKIKKAGTSDSLVVFTQKNK